ncbi:U1 small nuclear ribonucleoprotein 70 kDa-like isoform X1 [Crassostrea angulata]|uniref:U1 small nuclear ribonucleoprotein 70 kDa-like isoform X1 n=1 Tax=Magallana angulata TaxID=2784310 RepID=UPI0022B08D34|nr:U1 small nuclear ribonucleoprotein 70 kDa-like isoform X1 [Crassostrea angulata]XP_052718076.1 U1 small nuclear ribonucleoprotein 70 kDa-like isoform X1 [Crassostrea angulata]XP_052718083.1 U1 small nuclear ribonucleoprotein 70 kDa-like isoform X1 [Crassostrea angulata]
MTAFLPPNLLALFAARDPIQYLPPATKQGFEKRRVPYAGVSVFLKEFEDPKDTPPPTRVETKDERKERKRKERAEQIAYKLEQDLALWDPSNAASATGDPYKTLFVARINYDSSESKLRREFEVYGSIRKISLVSDKTSGKPRGYAFIEFEHERDMHSAYKHADGKKIDGRRVLVDVERGRTVKGWRPRRLGGGLGGTRKGGPDENTRFSGRDEFSSSSYRGREESPARDRSRRRSRSRERPARRSRSRERPPRRSRSRDRERPRREEPGEEKERKRSRRSRSRERKRSRSRERKRTRRSRSRDRKRDRESKRDEGADQDFGEDGVPVVKEEDVDQYTGYGGYNPEDQNGGEEEEGAENEEYEG